MLILSSAEAIFCGIGQKKLLRNHDISRQYRPVLLLSGRHLSTGNNQ